MIVIALIVCVILVVVQLNKVSKLTVIGTIMTVLSGLLYIIHKKFSIMVEGEPILLIASYILVFLAAVALLMGYLQVPEERKR